MNRIRTNAILELDVIVIVSVKMHTKKWKCEMYEMQV